MLSPTLLHLISLQAIDLDLRRLRAELAEVPRRTASALATRDSAAKALADTRKKFVDEEALRRRQELDIAAHRIKVERLSKQLDNATSTAQVMALENERNFTRAAIAKLEDEELASMERTEELEAAVQQRETTLTQADAALTRAQSTGADTAARHAQTVDALERERAGLRSALFNPPADWPASTPEAPAALALYDRVVRSKGTGLAEATPDESGGGQCSACRMRVRPQRWQDIKSREHAAELYSCETCGRLLFFDPRRNAPGAAPEIDRMHAAIAEEQKTPPRQQVRATTDR